ncbi:MAG: hypothetical protein A3J63_02885 [Candidatus Moranbacteria bacterium RIFCSPHIGHO2_02_FULL_40_12b]|nr:MAG: hypothetical protein A3J63_02885 [Candidatus Moranbacteria bacterium RIFCSPHIGHO2_02_FULL_40_12b]
MKKIIIPCLVIGLVLFFAPAKKASAVITEAEMDGDPMDNENHFIWDVMAQMQTPDDLDCEDVAEAALLAGGIPAENVAGPRDGACEGLASMRTNMESGMGQGDESVETNLWDATNWHSVENLYFEHSTGGVADGRIAFTIPIDFMSYNFMTFMMNFGNAMETGDGLIGLDADIVGGMAGYGAVLTMYNVDDFEDPEILVNGEEDTGGVVSGLVYDRDAHTITFNAAHFSTFEVVEGSSETPKISKVKIQKYISNSGETRLKFIISGDYFNKGTDVTLGGKEPLKISYKKGSKIVAFFKFHKIQKAQKPKMKLKVINGNTTKRYKNRILLKDIINLKLNELKIF